MKQDDTLIKIEEKEKEILFKFGWIFKNSLNEFSTSVDRSLGYLDKIVLPMIIASKEDKSYNPFAQIIEKYAMHILIHKLEKEGYKILPLGYSADLNLENENHILSIDIKTANLDNPSDFRQTIPIGINQMTHVAKLRIDRKFLPSPYFVYPTIPPFYKMPNGNTKLILTYGLMFIYPKYKDLMDDFRGDYLNLFRFFKTKVEDILIPIISNTLGIDRNKARGILESKPEQSRYTREELITESIIRGIFIHGMHAKELLETLKISTQEMKIIDDFSKQLINFTDKIRDRNIKPIAIVAISIPNGLLKEVYSERFVSGKNYAKSARYHYGNGIFEILKSKKNEDYPRILFIDVDKNSIKALKQYFNEIILLDYQLKKL